MDPGRLWDASGRPLDGRFCPGSVRPLAGLDSLGPRQRAPGLLRQRFPLVDKAVLWRSSITRSSRSAKSGKPSTSGDELRLGIEV